MEDITPKLYNQVKVSFQNQVDKSDLISKLYAKVRDGTATYKEANEFAIEVGRMLAQSFANNLSSEVLPDGKMYYNIAKGIIRPSMENNYSLITDVTNQIQKTLNEEAGIGIKAIKPPLNEDKIEGIINRVSNESVFDDIKWILDEPIILFSQSIVDDAIKANAEFHEKVGMSPKIVRKVAGNCCDWCRAVAGTYIYPEVPKDVYRRHQRCRCTVDYHPGNGKKQNIHSKKWKRDEDNEKIENRKQIGKSNYIGENVTPYYYGTAKPGKGKVKLEDGLSASRHIEEIEVANFINKMFGGEITVLNEANIQGVKTADFLWNNKLWDLKTVTTEKAADSAVRKGLKQIKSNPGGIILDYRNHSPSMEKLLEVVEGRMKRGIEKDTDIMMIFDEKNIKVFRYKK